MRSLRLALLPAVALLASCDNKESAPSSDSSPAAPEIVPPSTPGEIIALESIGLVDPKLHRETPKTDWQGEVFNDLALAQLKTLGKQLAKASLDFDAILTPNASTPPLVPPLEEVFQDETFTIRRTVKREDTPPLEIPFPAALAQLTAPFQSIERIKFKIFSVDLNQDGTPRSMAYAQITGLDENNHRLTRRARWECLWKWKDQNDDPLLSSVRISDFEETSCRAPFVDASGAVFKDTPAYHEQFLHGMEHWAGRIEGRYGIGISGWHGMALGDVNGDGLDDLYLCEPGGLPNRLFIANPDGTVTDASETSGTNFRLQTQAALLVDLDNDGDQDLTLATTLGLIFLANDGKGVFTVKAKTLVPEAAPVALAAADIDLDGDLDLYTACYSLRQSNTDASKRGQENLLGRPIPYHDANNGGRNVLFRNDRNWKFTDATVALGLDENNRRYSFAPTWEDYDNDGDPDLYVANDYGRNNLYRNDRDEFGNARFTDVAAEAGVEDISAGMSACWGDADGDGDQDLYVSNMWSSAGNRIAYQRNFKPNTDKTSLAEFQRHARGNSLFLNNGDGTFTDASLASGVTMGRWAWGSRFADLNNDGRQDLVVANGFLTQPDTGDL